MKHFVFLWILLELMNAACSDDNATAESDKEALDVSVPTTTLQSYNDTHIEGTKKSLRILVLLPHSEGQKKLPFGAEMSGAAGKLKKCSQYI